MSGKVSAWLEDLRLGQYAARFEENAIDWDLLSDLDQETLKDIGVDTAGHRLKILKAAKALQIEPLDPFSIPDEASSSVSELNTDADTSAWSRTPGERKPVTMLFADIVGSTTLTEKLDAEDAHDLLYRATQCMCQAVEYNQGTVCRFMGDGIMAMFGAPISSERHALEACRAALDMQASIDKYANELDANYRNGVQIRVGLHSGEVVVLEVGDDPDKPEYDASGPTVPLAARMEQSAAAGTILLTEQTRALAGDLIETNDLTAVTVKGVSEPVTVHRLNNVHSAEELSTTKARRPIVGRKSELAQFRGLLEACLESGHGQTVFVRGEAGIGKTRLVEEMTRLAQTRGFTGNKALILDFGTGKGQGAVPSLVRSLLGIAQGSGKRDREMALDQAENDGFVEHENRIFLNDLLDLTQPPEYRAIYDAMDQQSRKEGKRTSVVDMLARLAARQPVFIVVEDLHWADDITLDYLARIATVVAECPALMVMTSRAEGDPVDTNWRARAGETPIVTWDLSPLRKEEAVQLVSGFINATDSLAKRCIERAAGNPLFLEQLLLSVEKGVTESVPDSIKSLVLARMDQLASEDKRALQAAAVLGQRFALEGLRFLINAPDYDCLNLVERHLLRPEAQLYLFAHALIQEGAYASLLKDQRIGLHLQAAEWYCKRDLVLYAEHLDQAGDANATDAYLSAAREQSTQYRPERALQLTRRGLEIAPEQKRFELMCLEGELLRIVGPTAKSIEVFRRAEEVANDEVERVHALMGLAEGLYLAEAHDQLLEVLKNIEQIANTRSLDLELARVHQIRGGVLFFRGDTEAGLEANKASLNYARDAGAPELETQAFSGMADVVYSRGRYISAHRYFTQCIELAHEHGYSRIIAANLPMRAEVSIFKNNFEAAEADLSEATTLAVKTRNLRAEVMAASVRGFLRAETGDFTEAEETLSRAVEITRILGAKMIESMCIWGRGWVAGRRGNLSEACQLAREAVDILSEAESGMTFYGPAALGLLAFATENFDERQALLAQAEDLLSGNSVAHNYLYFYELAMETCLQIADWDGVEKYASALEEYTSAEPLPRCDFFISCGRALAAHGRGNRDQASAAELQRLHDEAENIGLKIALPALGVALASR